MGYSWEKESSGGGMSSTGGAGFSSAREAYKETTPRSRPASSPSRSTVSRPASDGGSRLRSEAKSETARFPKARPGATPRPIGLTISTESTHPVVVLCDHTGSMGEWPEIIREKLALLGKEVERYAPNYAISFAFVGDTRCDSHGLQIRNFAKGPALAEHLGDLYAEGKGGDNEESYGVGAYYYLEHCEIPNAVKSILMIILDAPDHGDVRPREVKEYTGDILNEPLKTKDIFARLMEKFSVYIVSVNGACRSYWTPMVGAQHFIPIAEPRDIVEVLIGIVAGELGEFKDFEMRSSARHSDKPDRVSRVGDSLRSVKKTSEKMSSGIGARTEGDEPVEKSMKSRKLV